ncbi:hypothetical protein CPLU01_14983 [Colletotrichum plurivorum]|uniref:Uncharacterized protein n=1 Tax=Colletotrichum plurivorum TaxID=2175906 RepID=A0A8H6JFB0_9PEZI|nr:hypothetical protein CPLU01_14983 [Colletotrichum plurivorum]
MVNVRYPLAGNRNPCTRTQQDTLPHASDQPLGTTAQHLQLPTAPLQRKSLPAYITHAFYGMARRRTLRELGLVVARAREAGARRVKTLERQEDHQKLTQPREAINRKQTSSPETKARPHHVPSQDPKAPTHARCPADNDSSICTSGPSTPGPLPAIVRDH